MPDLLCIAEPDQLAALPTNGLAAIAPELLVQHAPDAHWVLVQGDYLLSYCSLWWHQVPPDPKHKLGLIGHYGALNEAAAEEILTYACQQLAGQGCTFAIAPIDGNTWRRYRAISDLQGEVKELSSEPVFFLEPENPLSWCQHFTQAGFEPIAQYYSAINTDLSQQDERLAAVEARLAGRVQIRPLHRDRLDAELQAIYQLSLTSFRHNFLYTPIAKAEFLAQYRQILPYLRSELVLMAEQQGQLVGFVFAVPDLLQAQRGEAITTVILKTVAVLPGRAFAGLGNLLVARCQTIAQQLGYTRVIHALMHETNHSRNLSRRYAEPIRRYTLFGQTLKVKGNTDLGNTDLERCDKSDKRLR